MKLAYTAGALCCALSLAACGSAVVNGNVEPTVFGQPVNLGSVSANASLAGVAAKIDAGIAVVQSDIPALCAIAQNAAVVAQAASATASVSGASAVAKQAGKAANDVSALASSALCSQGLTGTVTDAVTIAKTIQEVTAATKTSASSIAAGASGN